MLLALAALLLAVPTPEEQALQLSRRIAHAASAGHEVSAEIAKVEDPALRAALQSQLDAPGLPAPAFALSHRADAEAALQGLGLLEGELPPLTGAGSFQAAPGGPCPDGHHAYPGGLAVHSLANLLHSLALGAVYEKVYGVVAKKDWLRAAALWHDEAKALTLRWRDGGDCGRETLIAKTAAHHVLGIAAAIAHKLPPPLVVVIASAHAPPVKENFDRLCGWLRAGSILATGKPDAVPCPSDRNHAPLEAFITNSSDADYALTGAASIAVVGSGGGWERFEKLHTQTELNLLNP